jgi:hypothetical protein
MQLTIENFGHQMFRDLQQVLVVCLSDCGIGHGSVPGYLRHLRCCEFSIGILTIANTWDQGAYHLP